MPSPTSNRCMRSNSKSESRGGWSESSSNELVNQSQRMRMSEQFSKRRPRLMKKLSQRWVESRSRSSSSSCSERESRTTKVKMSHFLSTPAGRARTRTRTRARIRTRIRPMAMALAI